MFKSRIVSVSIFGIFIGSVLFFVNGFVAAAQDDAMCSGVVEGYTCNSNSEGYYGIGSPDCSSGTGSFLNPMPSSNPFSGWKMGHSNPNALVTDFNAHDGSQYPSRVTDLYIAGEACGGLCTTGLAPASEIYAACLNDDSPETQDAEEFFTMKGYGWNTNLGFMSFDCTSGYNTGVDCGDHDYGVLVTEEWSKTQQDENHILPSDDYTAYFPNEAEDLIGDNEKIRLLVGDAWNPAFGYIQFNGKGGGVSGTVYSDYFTSSYSPLSRCYAKGSNVSFPYEMCLIAGGPQVYEIVNIDDKFLYVCNPTDSGTEISANGQQAPSCVDGIHGFDWVTARMIAGTYAGENWSILMRSDIFTTQNSVKTWLDNQVGAWNYTFDEFLSSQPPSDNVSPQAGGHEYKFGAPATARFVYELGNFLRQSQENIEYTDPFEYGVFAVRESETSSYWYLHGWAWTNAKVWLNFDGIRITLPESPLSSANCEQGYGLCVELMYEGQTYRKDLFRYDYGANAVPYTGTGKVYPPVADGSDGYELAVYLRDGSGNDFNLDDGYEFKITEISTEGDIKLNQVDVDVQTSTALKAVSGGTARDLIPYLAEDIPALNKESVASGVWNEEEIPGLPGKVRYILNSKFVSYAPSNSANISWTTNTTPSYKISNNFDEKGTKSSQVALGGFEFEMSRAGETPSTGTGSVGAQLEFRPEVYVDKLYSGGLSVKDDKILGMVNFSVPVYTTLNGSNIPSDMNVEYRGDCLGYTAEGEESNCNGMEFSYDMVNGEILYIPGGFVGPVLKNLKIPSDVTVFVKDASGTLIPYQRRLEISNLTEGNPLEVNPGAFAGGQTSMYSLQMKSVISYIKNGFSVKYWSNSLPRVKSILDTPFVFVSGQIRAQEAKSSSLKQQAVLTTGDALSNAARNAINKNLSKYSPSLSVGTDSFSCNANGSSVTCSGATLIDIKSTGEKVYYLSGNDVVIDGGDGKWTGDYVIIVQGGNVYIDQDLYNEDGDSQLVIVALRTINDKESEAGNVFIKNTVKNLQATVVADGVVHSYVDDQDLECFSVPDNSSCLNLFFQKLASEGNSYQLKWDGSIASKNTIGGAISDFDGDGDSDRTSGDKTLYLSRANQTTENVLEAQSYDLNYLRLVGMGLALDSTGLPIDQQCGKGLMPAEVTALNLCLTQKEGVDAKFPVIFEGKYCDGIHMKKFETRNPVEFKTTDQCEGKSIPAYVHSGDLIEDLPEDKKALGLDDDQNVPVYIFYKPAKSFVLGTK